jgi:DNA-binding response OmpR family regulator
MDTDIPKVVVVDNSPTIKTLFKRSTEKLGIDLTLFDSAEETRTYLESNRPDLLILSIILPDKDGLSFLKELRKLPLHQDTSVIMVSSKDYMQDREAAARLGVLEFIPKPMSMQTIADFVVKYTKAEHTI